MNKKQIPGTAVTLLAMTCLLISACKYVREGSGPAVAEASEVTSGPATTNAQPSRLELWTGKGYIFRVWMRQTDKHEGAAVAVVQTAANNDPKKNEYGLMFLQRNEAAGESGQGMLCQRATRLKKKSNATLDDDALTCSQDVGTTHETLTVGALSSEYCADLKSHQKKKVATDAECQAEFPANDRLCICYEIKHTAIQGAGGMAPPTSGSGSGGRP